MLVKEFRQFVIKPVLEEMAARIGPSFKGPAAEELLLGIALHESDGLLYARQIRGPAIGPFQMERATYEDLMNNSLAFKPALRMAVQNFSSGYGAQAEEMAFNWYYAVAVARAQLYRFPEALPAAGDLKRQASYWKKYWNTIQGSGTVEQYISHWHEYVDS